MARQNPLDDSCVGVIVLALVRALGVAMLVVGIVTFALWAVG